MKHKINLLYVKKNCLAQVQLSMSSQDTWLQLLSCSVCVWCIANTLVQLTGTASIIRQLFTADISITIMNTIWHSHGLQMFRIYKCHMVLMIPTDVTATVSRYDVNCFKIWHMQHSRGLEAKDPDAKNWGAKEVDANNSHETVWEAKQKGNRQKIQMQWN